jgi:CRP/FNR family cyclic AMP-dependent transcriptional regulator
MMIIPYVGDVAMNDSLYELLQDPRFPEHRAWHKKAFRAKETLLQEGEASRDLYLVLSGCVRVMKQVKLDDDRRLRPGFSDLKERETFGEMCLFEQDARSASVVAVSDCEVAVIDGGALIEFLDAHPELGYRVLKDLMQTVANRLRKANERVTGLFAWGLKSHGLDEHF